MQTTPRSIVQLAINFAPWCPPCSPQQSKLVVHYELALQRYRNTRYGTKASAGCERETHSEFSSYQVGASNTAVALPRLSPRTCHQRRGCSRKTAVDIASLQLRSEENLDHPGHSTKMSRPWLRVTGPRNHYEQRLNIDVWPHDKPNTTQGPTNIAGLVQVQPHTINRQRLLVLRCE